jgi:hypothetical protein
VSRLFLSSSVSIATQFERCLGPKTRSIEITLQFAAYDKGSHNVLNSLDRKFFCYVLGSNPKVCNGCDTPISGLVVVCTNMSLYEPYRIAYKVHANRTNRN